MNTNYNSELDRQDYEAILSIPAHIVIIISFDGKILKTNMAQGFILGWNADEVIGKSLKSFTQDDDHEIINKNLNSLVTGEIASTAITTRCLHKDGGVRLISWTAISKDGFIYAIGSDNTKNFQAENALLQQTTAQIKFQTRFTTFFEQSILAMEIFSLDGFPLAVNKAWEDLFQISRDKLTGYNILKDPLVKNSIVWDYVQRAYKGESVDVPSFWFDPSTLKRPGRGRWLEAWISPVKDDRNVIREVAVVFKDVTEKIETQKELAKSILDRKATQEKFQIISDRLSMAVKAGNIGIWEWVPETNHVFWDETTEKIYGYTAGTFPRTKDALNERLHPEDIDFLWSTIHDSIKNKNSYNIDHRILRADGTQRWVQESGMALYDENGIPYHLMGTVIDITDRVEAEADQKFLSQASELLNFSFDYKEILKTISNHAIKYFCDGVVVDKRLAGGGIQRIMVVHPDDEYAKKILEIDTKYSFRHEDNPILDTLVTGEPVYHEDSNVFLEQNRQQQSAEYYHEVKALNLKSTIRVRLKGRESILGMITFFTVQNSQKKLEKRHVWLAEELSYRASMAFENALIHQRSQEAIRSRDEFLSIASHELKTPMQSLTLQNQMRKRNLDKNIVDAFAPEKISKMIEADLRHLMRINRLIDDMLDISSIRAGKLTFLKEKIEFCSFVKDVIERFRPQVEAVGSFMTVKFCGPVNCHIDIYRIEQVIVNLLTNAVKYGAGSPIKIDIRKELDKVQLYVEDQGPGIKEQDTERIFERFERAISSNEVSGLGLGLYISRQIMEQNHGALFVRSTVNKGSTFIMELSAFD